MVVGMALLLALAGVAGAAYLLDRAPLTTKSPPGPNGTMSGTAAKECHHLTCRGEDPREHQCVNDAETAAGVKTEYGLISLSYSAACRALWAEIDPFQDQRIVSVYMKSDKGDALSLKSDRLIGNSKNGRYTPMLPSENRPQHAEVCVAYQEFEACADSDGVSRVKPYPSSLKSP